MAPARAATGGSESDSDAPEELTAQQGVERVEEIRRAEREHRTRVAREGKERRRQWAQRKTQQRSSSAGIVDDTETEPIKEEDDIQGMLPSSIVNLLAAREKQVFSSDSEEETVDNEPIAKKKKHKHSGPEAVLLKDIPSAQCLQNSLEFLKKRKMQVPRSHSTLKNAGQALRLISSRGGLLNKS